MIKLNVNLLKLSFSKFELIKVELFKGSGKNLYRTSAAKSHWCKATNYNLFAFYKFRLIALPFFIDPSASVFITLLCM
jgi:hypothetical protein